MWITTTSAILSRGLITWRGFGTFTRWRNTLSSLNACLEDPEIVARDPVRFEILRHFGRFVTESSRHMAEYVPYFMQHSDEMARMKVEHRTAESFANQHAEREERIAQAKREAESAPIELSRSHEYAAVIIHAMETDTPAYIYGNVLNTNLITNLPASCCVEVPTLVNRAGLQPCYVGALRLSVRHSVRLISTCKG